MKKVYLKHFSCLFLLLPFLSSAQTVTSTGSLNSARWSQRTQLLSNGNVLLFGGDDANINTQQVFASSELYNPATQSWSYTGSMKSKRSNFTSVLLRDGRVMAIGGSNNDSSSLKSCEAYDPATGTWSYVSDLQKGRYLGASIKLQDGRVLVAGGDAGQKTTELYDAYSNTWSYTGAMNLDHGTAMAVVMLDDGTILATGGSNAPTRAEIYNPATGQWTLLAATMSRNHYYHSMVRISTGRFLIVGTQSGSTQDQLSAETYSPLSNSFFNTGNLLTNVGVASLTPLDNGKVLLYSMGDVFSPFNTKCVQIYDPTAGTWSANTYNFIGANVGTSTMLQTGKVLLAGGSPTTGNGATPACYLVNQDQYTACTPPATTYTMTGNPTCNGTSSYITVPTSESGVSYQLFIGDMSAGLTRSGGSSLSYIIPENLLAPGKNIFSIRLFKSGCPYGYLQDTAIIYVSMPNIPKPDVTAGGPTSFCPGQNVVLSAPLANGYQWSTGATTRTITVTTAGYYRVRVKNSAGCYSAYSDLFQVYVSPTSVNAGSSQSICISSDPFTLTGFSPAGGTWSGTGVSPQGVFNPAVSGPGLFTLTYQLCSATATKTITVAPLPQVPDYTVKADEDTLCAGYYTYIRIQNPASGINYQLWLNNTFMGNSSGSAFNVSNVTNANTYTIKGIQSNTCGADTLSKNYTIYLYVNPSLKVGTKTPAVCSGNTASVYVVKSQPNVYYQLKIGNTNVGASVRGNGDTLFLPTSPILQNTVYSVYGSYYKVTSCINAKTLTQTVAINISGPKARFTVTSYNVELGNPIHFINTSKNPGGTYLWTSTAGGQWSNSTDQQPVDLVYTTVGAKTIKLRCTDTGGCLDSVTRKVNVIAPVPAAACTNSVSSGYYGLMPASVAFDKEDNMFQGFKKAVSGLFNYSTRGDSLYKTFEDLYRLNYIQPLVKYNAKGVLQWTTSIRHNASSAFGGTVSADSLGNSYYAFYLNSTTDSVRIYSTDDTYISFYPPQDESFGGSVNRNVVVVKYNKYGIAQWYNTFFEYFSDLPGICITHDKNLNTYVTARDFICKYNEAGNEVWKRNSGFAGIKINSQGNLWGVHIFGGLMLLKIDPDGNQLADTHEWRYTNNYSTNIIPRFLEMDDQDNIYVYGNFYGQFVFNKDTLTDPYVDHYGVFLAKFDQNGKAVWARQLKVSKETALKGLTYKNGKLLFAAGGAKNNTLQYNGKGSVYADAITFANGGNFVGLKDTAALAPFRIIKADDNGNAGDEYRASHIAFSKNSSRILYANSDINGVVCGQTITPKNILASAPSQVNTALLQLELSCLFAPVKPTSVYTVSNPCTGTAVTFLDKSDENPTSWSWSFPGGTPSSSTSQNPVVTYAAAGLYTVTLVASNGIGAGSTYTRQVRIDDVPALRVTPSIVCKGSDALVTASGASSYVWNNNVTGSSITLNALNKDTLLTVKGISAGGCSTEVQHPLTASVCTDVIGTQDAATVYIYPNPCNSSFTIKTQQSEQSSCDIILYNTKGEAVLNQKGVTWSAELSVDVSSLASGIYHLLLITNKGELIEHNIAVQ